MRTIHLSIPDRAALLAVAGLLALATAGAAQTDPCTPPSGDTGFAEVKVNVAAGTFDKVLPFDVPLRLCGATPPEIQRVEVLYAGGRQPLQLDEKSCEDAGAQARDAAAEEAQRAGQVGGEPAAGPRPVPQPPAWTSVGFGRLDGTTFRAVVPRLEAQSYYAFCFLFQKSLAPAEVADFTAKARATLDAALTQFRSLELKPDDVTALRGQLRRDLQAAAGAGRVIAPGTLFDPRLPPDQVDGRFLALLRAVIQPQIRRAGALNGQDIPGLPATPGYGARQLDLSQDLDRLRKSPALDHFASALETAAAANPNFASLMANDLQDELALIRADDQASSRLAQGLDPASGGAELPQATDPASAAAIGDNYQRLYQTLTGLDRLLTEALGGGMIAPFVSGLSAADRTELQQLKPQVPTTAGKAFRLAGLARDVGRGLGERQAALEDLVAAVKAVASSASVADASTSGNFQTAQNFYISADAGLLVAPALDEVVPYVGTNIYFRPVNKDASLRSLGTFRQTFSRRFALTLGLTAASVDEPEGSPERKDLFSSQNLVVGAGLRISDSIRFGAGAFVFREDDPSPLVDELKVTATYYVSISFDMDVASAFKGGLGELFK